MFFDDDMDINPSLFLDDDEEDYGPSIEPIRGNKGFDDEKTGYVGPKRKTRPRNRLQLNDFYTED